MKLLSAVCEALPAVLTMEGAESGAGGPGLLALLQLVMRATAAAGPAGALLLLRLPCILAPATDRLIGGQEVTADCQYHGCSIKLRHHELAHQLPHDLIMTPEG